MTDPEENAGMSGGTPESQTTEAISAPATKSARVDCPRWMYHRPGVYCHTCEGFGETTDKGVSLHLDLPPGGNVTPDFKKPKKEKK